MGSLYKLGFAVLFSVVFAAIGSNQAIAQNSGQIDTVEIKHRGIEDKPFFRLVVVANSATYQSQTFESFPDIFRRYIFVDSEVLSLFSKHVYYYFDSSSCKGSRDTLYFPNGAFGITCHNHNGSKKVNILPDYLCSRRFFSNMIFELMMVKGADVLTKQLQLIEQRL